MFKFLKEPYPLEQNKKIILARLLSFSVLVYFILVVFQPFGLKDHHGIDLLIYSGGFVLCGFIYLSFHYFVVESFFLESKWNLAREILNNLFITIIIGFINAVYYSLYEGDILSLEIILVFLFYTLVIGIFPLTIFIMVRQNRLLKYYLKQAEKINIVKDYKNKSQEADCKVELKSINPEKKYNINCSDLILLSARDNYILLHYMIDGQLQKELIRNTMKHCSAELEEFTMFFRCHRSFIVNLDKIESIDGNAQGLKLKLKSVDDKIPVSRHLIKEFSSKMSS
jgi:hypothetical protein